MEVRWIESSDEFKEIASKWDEAVRRCDSDEPFLLSDFVLSWWKHFSQGRSLRILVVFDGEKVVGGLPLYSEKVNGIESLRYVGAADFDVANYTNILRGSSSSELIEAILVSLVQRKDWDILTLDRLRASSENYHTITQAVEASPLLTLRQAEMPSFQIQVPASLEDHLKQVKKNLRQNVRRAYKSAEQMGGLDLRKISGSQSVERLFDTYVELSVDSYSSRSLSSTFENERLCAFFKDLFVRLDRAGSLDAYALYLAGELLAIGFGYSVKCNLNYILTTFNKKYTELNPGHLLMAELLKVAVSRNSPVMDLFTGKQLHKTQWTSDSELVRYLEIGRPTIVNRMKAAKYFASTRLDASEFGRGVKRIIGS
jgi:CelD/BcsL family acetyltransferase involved in cellulose biosynthesis